MKPAKCPLPQVITLDQSRYESELRRVVEALTKSRTVNEKLRLAPLPAAAPAKGGPRLPRHYSLLQGSSADGCAGLGSGVKGRATGRGARSGRQPPCLETALLPLLPI